MTSDYQDLGHCQQCAFEWVIGDASLFAPKKASRHDGTKPAAMQCPFCGSGKVKIKKELNK